MTIFWLGGKYFLPTNNFYRLFFTDQQFLPIFFFNFNFILFLPTTNFGDIPFPFLVVKESKYLKNNNTKVGYFQFKFWKCYMKSGLVNFFASIIIIIIKTLFTLGLERKIYRNEMITAKDKKVTHASHSRASRLQARLRETSNTKNAKASSRKRRKLAHRLLWI